MDTVTRSTGEIAAAKLRLAAAEVGIGPGEPLHPLIDAMAETVAALHDTRQPFTEDAFVRAVALGTEAHAGHLIGAMNMRNVLHAACIGIALTLAGAAGGYWWHGNQELVAGVSAGQQECHEQHGGTVCLIPIWTKLPPQ